MTTVLGVVSFGIGCAKPEYPGYYARVNQVLPWIKEVMEDNGTDDCPEQLNRHYNRQYSTNDRNHAVNYLSSIVSSLIHVYIILWVLSHVFNQLI